MSRAGTVTHRLPASHSATGLMFRRPRLLATLVLMLALGAFTLDVRRPPGAQWSTRAAIGVVHLYQRTASPLMPALGVRCRFRPTCSHYAEAVLRTHGLPAGAWLTARRLARCGPWTKDGTADPPS
jgi:putative membrane protein insertion efficiency factor